jgi:hypothetical protein
MSDKVKDLTDDELTEKLQKRQQQKIDEFQEWYIAGCQKRGLIHSSYPVVDPNTGRLATNTVITAYTPERNGK